MGNRRISIQIGNSFLGKGRIFRSYTAGEEGNGAHGVTRRNPKIFIIFANFLNNISSFPRHPQRILLYAFSEKNAGRGTHPFRMRPPQRFSAVPQAPPCMAGIYGTPCLFCVAACDLKQGESSGSSVRDLPDDRHGIRHLDIVRLDVEIEAGLV